MLCERAHCKIVEFDNIITIFNFLHWFTTGYYYCTTKENKIYRCRSGKLNLGRLKIVAAVIAYVSFLHILCFPNIITSENLLFITLVLTNLENSGSGFESQHGIIFAQSFFIHVVVTQAAACLFYI